MRCPASVPRLSIVGVGSPSAPHSLTSSPSTSEMSKVTTEYENLLRLQKEHQTLTALKREAEVTQPVP